MATNKKPVIVALAEAIAIWFPDLGGRSIAVSEVDPFGDKTNVPTLPLAVTALINETAVQSSNGGGKITLSDDIVVQFIYASVKYNRQDGAVTPFYAFYDYEAIRDRLLTNIHSWRTPRNGGIQFPF